MPILGVGWILGLFAVNKNTIVFEYAFAIINGLQVDLKTLNQLLDTYLHSQATLQKMSLITFFFFFFRHVYSGRCT